MELIHSYFPTLSGEQIRQFSLLPSLYKSWNERINLISRKDIDHLCEHHILHSLSIELFFHIPEGASVLDVGTGGGFPGIPLAILRPDLNFVLIDSIGKKIKVVEEVAQACGLKNVQAKHCHTSQMKTRFSFIVSRAVTALPAFVNATSHLLGQRNEQGGILYLKGGDFDEELKVTGWQFRVYDLHSKINRDFFETKRLVYLTNG